MKSSILQKSVFLFLLLLVVAFNGLRAQPQFLPLDPQVRTGKLENGLTYYIRHNNTRPQLADFYIAQKVGSIQETPSQRGLAHFLEHMALNGTVHFPGKELISWCEKLGVHFGQNLNAYTSIDETVYHVSDVPVTRSGIVDSCLLILRDWSNGLLLTEEEIDNERGVIHEEWRTRQDATSRLYERVLPSIYKGSKYADCWPIGNMEVVNQFEYRELRDYYTKWYRPDLQGLIIVGDINPLEVEQKIRNLFAPIPAPVNPEERIYYTVEEPGQPLVVIETDREMTATQCYLYFTHEAFPDSVKNHLSYWMHRLQANLVAYMLNVRLFALQKKADAPFLGAAVGETNFFVSRARSAFTAMMNCREGEIEEALAATYLEILRASHYGFTEAELSRIKQDMINGYEREYNERNTQKNEHYSGKYVRHFLDNEPAMEAGFEYHELVKKLVPGISLEDVNQMLRQFIASENPVLLVFGPEKESLTYPDPETLLAVMKKVETEHPEPYEEDTNEDPLVQKIPDTGILISEREDPHFGMSVLTLGNGMTVYIKPTDFKTDEVLFHLQRKGGNSLYPDEEVLQWRYAFDLVQEGGLGAYSIPELIRKLSGKQVGLQAWTDLYFDGIRGGCIPRDFETLMQLTYLYFTAPRLDHEAVTAWKMRLTEQLRNEENNPVSVFHDSIRTTVYGGNERVRRIQETETERIDPERCLEIFKNAFADASEYTVRVVGNVSVDSIRPYLVKYLGALPSSERGSTWKNTSLKDRTGLVTNRFSMNQEIPAARVFIGYHEAMDFTWRNRIIMNLMSQILSMEYTDKVREEEGGTYGVQVNGWIGYEPTPLAKLQIMFETAPEKEPALVPLIDQEIERLQQQGPDEEKLAKAREFLIKHHINEQRENGYWDARIVDLTEYGMDSHTGYEEVIRSITAAEILEFSRQLFGTGNRTEVVLTQKPE